MYVRHEQHPVQIPATAEAQAFADFLLDSTDCGTTPLNETQNVLAMWAADNRESYEGALLQFFAPAIRQKLLAMELQVKPNQTEIIRMFEKEERLALLPFARLVIDRRNHRC